MTTGSVTGDNGAGWGGVDEGGTKDPDANSYDVWDDYQTGQCRRYDAFDEDE